VPRVEVVAARSDGTMGRSKTMLDVDTATEAVLLRLDRNVFHHGSLGVIRSLPRLRITPTAGSTRTWVLGLSISEKGTLLAQRRC